MAFGPSSEKKLNTMFYHWLAQGGWSIVLLGLSSLLVLRVLFWMGDMSVRTLRIEFKYRGLAEKVVWMTQKLDDTLERTKRATGELPPVSLADERPVEKTRVRKKT